METIGIRTFRGFMLLFFLVNFSLQGRAQDNEKIIQAFEESYTLETKGENAKAIESLKRVYDEKSYEINIRLGWLNYQQGIFSESMGFYTRAISLKPMSIEARFGLVLPASSLGQWDKVVSLYNQILEIDPRNTVASYKLGLIYYGRLEYEKAKPLFERVVNLYPFDYYGLIMLAWTHYRMGNLREAKVLFNKVLLVVPNDADALRGLSLIK